MTTTIEQFLATYPVDVQTVANQARAIIKAMVPQANEKLYLSYKAISYTMGDKMTEGFGYIGPMKDRINIGFYRGSVLPDPSGLLEGTGKLLRHVKVYSPGTLEDPALRQLILESVSELNRFLAEKK